MRIGVLRRSDIGPLLLEMSPQLFWPSGEGNARRQRRVDPDARACAGGAVDVELCRYTLRPALHTPNAESEQAIAFLKACAVVSYLQRGQVLAVPQANGQHGRLCMPDRIGDRFLADAVEGIRDAQGNVSLVALALGDYLHRT